MPNTTPLDRQSASWLPSFDLHEQDGELVLHADMRGFDNEDVQISLDGGDLIVQAEGRNKGDAFDWYYNRLPLPFAPQALRVVSRPGHKDLEVHIPIPSEGRELTELTTTPEDDAEASECYGGCYHFPFTSQALHLANQPGQVSIPPGRREETMSWQEARNRDLAHWSAIRDAIGTADPVELLTQINAADGLCERAREVAGDPIDYCARCLFYQQFGGCREVSGRMSECVAARDWEGLRALVDEFIAHLLALDVSGPAAWQVEPA